MKRKKIPKKPHFSSLEMTMAKKPYYNAYVGGYGPHGSRKYKRNKEKENFRKSIRNDGLF